MMKKNGIWVFCENGPQGVREVSYELLGAAARLAKNAGTRVVAVALGVGAPAEELCARGADEVLLVEDAALDAPEEMRYTEEICALAREFLRTSSCWAARCLAAASPRAWRRGSPRA